MFSCFANLKWVTARTACINCLHDNWQATFDGGMSKIFLVICNKDSLVTNHMNLTNGNLLWDTNFLRTFYIYIKKNNVRLGARTFIFFST